MRYRYIIVFAAVLLCFNAAHAQTLPRGLTDEERALIESGMYTPIALPGHKVRTPDEPPRSIGEWEELQAIAITWTQYRGILAEIVKHAVKEVEVIIVARDSSSAKGQLESYGVNPDSNIVYIQSDYNSVWIRDYGPNAAYIGNVDTLVLVDWIYNRPRAKDDIIPAVIADKLGLSLYSTAQPPNDLVNTGGNYMSDGLGRAFSSELVIEENGPNNIWGSSNHDKAAIDQIMFDFLGVTEYVTMPVLPYDGIHHIDMHMKLLDERRLLVGQYPDGIADGPQIEANIQYIIENFKVASGRDYEVIRIPMPPDQFGRYPHQGGYYRTYANALFVNKTILVPTYEERYDTTALRIWREAMPGYKVVGINCNQIIPAGGAIHCITKEIGVDKPLWLAHEAPLEMPYDPAVLLEVHAEHQKGVEEVMMFYSKNGAAYDSLLMSSTDGFNWAAEVADIQPSDTIHYYFRAKAVDGKVVHRPLVAPEGHFTLSIGAVASSTGSSSTLPAGMRIYPNPAGAITCVEIELDQACEGRLELSDVNGRRVALLHDGVFSAGTNKLFFDARTVTPGIYVMRFESASAMTSRRIVAY